MVAVAPLIAKANWARPISRIAHIIGVVGIVNIIIMIPIFMGSSSASCRGCSKKIYLV